MYLVNDSVVFSLYAHNFWGHVRVMHLTIAKTM